MFLPNLIVSQYNISKKEIKLNPRNNPKSPPRVEIKSTIVIRKSLSYSENIIIHGNGLKIHILSYDLSLKP